MSVAARNGDYEVHTRATRRLRGRTLLHPAHQSPRTAVAALSHGAPLKRLVVMDSTSDQFYDGDDDRAEATGRSRLMSVPSQVSADGHDPLISSFSASYAGVVAFIAVATEGSFARAGERLGIGRSAVSRSVQKLESQLDTRLFQRTTRATSLTREGDLFFA